MSSTSSIFNAHQINCTILGGKKSPSNPSLNVAVILLNKGNSHLLEQNLETLIKCGFANIVSVASEAENYSLEDFVQKFPEVKFVIPRENTTDGNLINTSMSLIDTPHTLVLCDSLNITLQSFTSQLAQKLASLDIFCVVPRLFSQAKTTLPSHYVAAFENSLFKIKLEGQGVDGMDTLFPYNHLGFYNTKKFKEIGGYDHLIKNAYWQNVDLACRAWLWGERIQFATSFSLFYFDENHAQDSTSDISYLRFYLKNVAPVKKQERVEIPFSQFFAFRRRSGFGLIRALKQFNSVREWVRENSDRFKMDASTLIENWKKEEA